MINAIKRGLVSPKITAIIGTDTGRTKTVSGYGAINSLPSDLYPNAPLKEMTLYSQTVNSIVQNGNFANGTTGWSASNGTHSASNNVYTLTGNGGASAVTSSQGTSLKRIGAKYNGRMYARVTNSVCTSIRLYLGGTFYNIDNPVQNQWYLLNNVYTTVNDGATLWIDVQHRYPDAATANGKVMEVKEVMAIDMGTSASDNPDYNLTADQMNAKYPNFISNGIKSTFGGRETIVGKNLFDKSKTVQGTYDTTTGALQASTTRLRTFVKVKGNTNYVRTDGTLFFRSQGEFDANLNYIGLKNASGGQGFTTSLNCAYLLIVYSLTSGGTETITQKDIVNQNIQLELGSTATTYEPYQSQQVYYPDLGYSLPNGIKNEFDLVSGKYTKNVSNAYTLLSGDITALTTSETNVDYIRINKPSDAKFYGNTTNLASDASIIFTGFTNGLYANDTSKIGVVFVLSTTQIAVVVAKGTYANLAAAQTALAGTQIIYQLATPVVTYKIPLQLGYNPPLRALKSGSIILEPTDPANATIPTYSIKYEPIP